MMFGRAGSVTLFLAKYGVTIPTIYGFGGIAAVLTLKLYPYIYMYTSGATESLHRVMPTRTILHRRIWLSSIMVLLRTMPT